MARFEVQTEQVDAGAVRQAETAERIRELAGRLGAPRRPPARPAATRRSPPRWLRCVTSWRGSLSMLADSVGSLATNLTAASSAYVRTDERAMPAPR